jgi:hypothetical protein
MRGVCYHDLFKIKKVGDENRVEKEKPEDRDVERTFF